MKNLLKGNGKFARNPKLVKYIIVHCSATPPGRDIGAQEIRRYHLQRGFKDIGYHFVVRLNGEIEAGCPLDQPGAHCAGKNYCSIGVCYVGGLDSCQRPCDTRTPAQTKALEDVISRLKAVFPQAEVRGHRDFANKACPCFDATAVYRKLGVVTMVACLAFASGCRSSKTADSTLQTHAETQAHFEKSHAVNYYITDSTEIVIAKPTLSMRGKDSTSVSFVANSIILRKVEKNNAENRLAEGQIVHNIHTSVEEKKLETETKPGVFNPVASVVVSLATVAALFLVIRFLRKKFNFILFRSR